MKNTFIQLFIISIISLTITSCKKESEHEHNEETATPTIIVSTISEGDTIQSGATVHISGTVTSSAEMHGYQLILHNHQTMTYVLTSSEDSHGTMYSFDEHWTNNVVDTSAMMLTIDVVKDHDGGIETKVIHFTCLP